MKTSEEVDCDMDLKLDGDLIEVLGLQSNVTVLKSQSESQSLEYWKTTRTPLQLITDIPCILHSLRWIRVLLKRGR